MRCSSELVFWLRSTAVRAANSASVDPSVARRILVGKMLISPPPRSAPPVCETYDVIRPSPAHMVHAPVHRTINFRECPKGELRRIPLPRTPVNKGMKEGRSACPGPDVRVGDDLAVQIPRSCFFLASKSSLVMMP